MPGMRPANRSSRPSSARTAQTAAITVPSKRSRAREPIVASTLFGQVPEKRRTPTSQAPRPPTAMKSRDSRLAERLREVRRASDRGSALIGVPYECGPPD